MKHSIFGTPITNKFDNGASCESFNIGWYVGRGLMTNLKKVKIGKDNMIEIVKVNEHLIIVRSIRWKI